MFAAMMEGILYLKSTKMNLKLNNTNQLVAISEPLVYKKRLQNNRQKQSLYGLSRRKRIRRNLVLLHSNDSTRILTTCKSPPLLSYTKNMRERERCSHEPGRTRNLVGPCKGIQRGRHASRFECTSCSTASHSSAMRNARPCLADGRFTLRSTYSSTCPQHHQQQPILANNGPLQLQSLLRSVAAFETILLFAAPPPLRPYAST